MRSLFEGRAHSVISFSNEDGLKIPLYLDDQTNLLSKFEWTGGGWASTGEDLARWAKMMYEAKAFDPSLLPQMLDGVAAPMLGRETKYGPRRNNPKDRRRNLLRPQWLLPGLPDGHDVFP